MKKITSILLVLILFCVPFLSSCATEFEEDGEIDLSEAVYDVNVDDISYYAKFRDKNITINVYNWGEYISDGSEGSLDVIGAFEEISGINVNYTNYATNEDMYTKLANDKVGQEGYSSVYDIIIPSDYMIAKMASEGMLEELNFDNIPNIKYIDEQYRFEDFDPEGKYSVPYTWGTVGIIYNKAKLAENNIDVDTVNSWDVFWDERFKGQILMFSNSRDAFAIGLARLGYSLNTENHEELYEAAKIMRQQKRYVQTYVMDQIFDKMQLEEAWIAPYYAGDAVTMIDANPNLAFAYPNETFNRFIDAICIPKGSKNKEAAEAFINFLCETEVAVANCEYICYSTPHAYAKEIILEDMEDWHKEIAYPTDEILSRSQSFVNLSRDTNDLLVEEWNDIIIGIDENSRFNKALVPVAIIVSLGLIILIILMRIRKNKKKRYY